MGVNDERSRGKHSSRFSTHATTSFLKVVFYLTQIAFRAIRCFTHYTSIECRNEAPAIRSIYATAPYGPCQKQCPEPTYEIEGKEEAALPASNHERSRALVAYSL